MRCKEWKVRRVGLVLTAVLAFACGGSTAHAQTTVGFEIGAVNVAGSSATVKVVLNAASTDAVAVQYATQDGTAVSPGDYTATTGTVVVPAGFTSQTFTINGINSAAAGKNFTATLANPVNATLGTSLVKITIDAAPPGGGGDPPGGGGEQPKDPPPPVLPVVQFESASQLCMESCGKCKLTVKLSAASKDIVTVEYLTNDNKSANSATEDKDYTGAYGTLTFAPGETSKTIEVPIIDDTDAEPYESFRVEIRSPTNATIGTNKTSIVTIVDNDSPAPPAFAGLKLKEIAFSGANNVVHETVDDQLGYFPPHWHDFDLDGATTSAGDRAFPVSYTRGNTMAVSAVFAVGSTEKLPATILIRGEGPENPSGAKINIPATSVAIKDGCDAILADVSASAPFDSVVTLHKPLSITWQFSTDGGTTWKAAGTSTNKMYITLGTPESPAYEASLAGGCEAGKGAMDEDTLVDLVWKKAFEPRKLKYNEKEIAYYKDWVFPIPPDPMNYPDFDPKFHTVKGILDRGGNTDCLGCCVIHLEFLAKQDKSLKSNYVIRKITTVVKGELMFVKTWEPPEEEAGPWKNVVKPNTVWADFHAGNKYQWAAGKEIVKDVTEEKETVIGQNSPNPASIFQTHFAMIKSTKTEALYDPSYGVKYDNLLQLEQKSLFGYAKQTIVMVEGVNAYQLEIRRTNPKNKLTEEEIKYGSDALFPK